MRTASPVHALLIACAQTDAEKEPAEFARRFSDLVRAATQRIEYHLRQAGIGRSSLPDLRQDVLVKIYNALRRAPKLSNPDAWLRQVCRNIAIDHHRRNQGHTFFVFSEEPTEGASTSSETERLERQGIDTTTQPDRMAEAARLGEECVEAIRAYADRAQARRGRGHQVVAWFCGHVLELSATQAAEIIAEQYGRTATGATVWQWTSRGGALVQELAASDDDPARAAMMTRLATKAA